MLNKSLVNKLLSSITVKPVETSGFIHKNHELGVINFVIK